MAQAEHLPIYKASYDLCLYLEQVVRGFSRYHKYTLGADLRDRAMTSPRYASSAFQFHPYLTNTGPALSIREIANNSSHRRGGDFGATHSWAIPVRSPRTPTRMPAVRIQGAQEPRGDKTRPPRSRRLASLPRKPRA